MTTFVITGSELHEAAAWASRVVPAKPATAVVGGLLLDAREGEVTLTATDYDTWATVTVPAMVKDPGRLLLSARLLTDVAKQVSRDVDMVIDNASGEVMARCGRSEWSLPALPVEDFPSSPAALPTVAEVDADAFRRAVARVLPAIPEGKPAAPALVGVRLEPCDVGLTLVATDSWHLHVAEIPLTSGEAPMALVLPELLRAAARHGGDGVVDLTAKGGMFGVASDDFRLSGRLIDAEFPRWRSLFPIPTAHCALIEISELSRVVDHVQVMAGPGDDDIIELRFTRDSVEASAFVTDRRARAEGACTTHGAEMSVNLRPLYLRDALAALPTTHAAVHVEKSRCLLLPCSASGEVVPGMQALIMGRKRPVR